LAISAVGNKAVSLPCARTLVYIKISLNIAKGFGIAVVLRGRWQKIAWMGAR